MFRGKKGEGEVLVLMNIIQIVLLIMIATGFYYFLTDVKENTLFEKSYASRDIALLLETAESVPGDIEVYYTEPKFDVGAYNYKFSENILRIYEGENYLYSIYYPFFLDTQLYETFESYDFKEPAAFVISKVKGNLEVKEHGSIGWEADKNIDCPAVDSTKIIKNNLAIIIEDNSLEGIKDYFVNNPKIVFVKKDEGENAIAEDTNFVLILDKQLNNKLDIEIPDDQQSEKLGCLIGNSILAKFPDADITIKKSTDKKLTTNKEGLAVGLIIGEELLQDVSGLNNAIKEGMEAYYNE
ncbi:hypothetical protein COV16_03640 [Candidatus Woesearchaeota archaeon CG10_big_fil_rev_8_21_14_0_10_34_8]|nr:MAG: hypothetical protein COV16_03640 [Candidatus Woesearchaeota archaeon CG10_big_fil_rev_8_21_14_0_10_34_8]